MHDINAYIYGSDVLYTIIYFVPSICLSNVVSGTSWSINLIMIVLASIDTNIPVRPSLSWCGSI